MLSEIHAPGGLCEPVPSLDKVSGSCKNVSMRTLPFLSVWLLALTAVAACSSESARNAGPAPSCAESPTVDVYAEAFDQYMVGLTPTPRRFLNAAGTDSALADPVFQGVQRKGPGYLYPGDSAGRAAVRSKLESVGNWPTLLVVWRGNETVNDSTIAIRLAGHYVGGAEDGTPAPAKAMHFACDTVPWQFVRTVAEQGA